jgi:ribulose kinase
MVVLWFRLVKPTSYWSSIKDQFRNRASLDFLLQQYTGSTKTPSCTGTHEDQFRAGRTSLFDNALHASCDNSILTYTFSKYLKREKVANETTPLKNEFRFLQL